MVTLGFKIDARPAEDVTAFAKQAQTEGFAELWVVEDLGLAGGIAQATAALAVTKAALRGGAHQLALFGHQLDAMAR